MVEKTIDINCDLGEGKGNDHLLMPLISSCNIACGGHYGDENSMRTAIKLAKNHNVKIGAHPGFPDKDNFGRKVLTMTKSELTQTIFDQLLQFYAICELEDVEVHHIKPHGALYNYAAINAPTADAIVNAMEATKFRTKLYAPSGSILAKKAENLFPLKLEAFIDRAYNSDLTLVARTETNALIEDKKMAWQQLLQMVSEGKTTTVQNEIVDIEASTFCIHGDHLNSVSILEYIHEQLPEHAIRLERL